jgi:hypothetical protein
MTNDSTLFDKCMKQAEYFAGRWDGRRNHEWKMTISLWTLLAAAVGFLGGKGRLEQWMIPIPIVLHALWLYGVWIANDFDKRFGRYDQNQAQKLLFDPSHKLEPIPAKHPFVARHLVFLADWSMQFQLLAATALSLLVWRFNRP